MKIVIDELSQRDDFVAVGPKVFEMGLEDRCGCGHAIRGNRPETMVEEYRHLHNRGVFIIQPPAIRPAQSTL